MGRGIDFAWSATSAGTDVVDQYVETLCGSGDTSTSGAGSAVR